jgi:cytochrome c553
MQIAHATPRFGDARTDNDARPRSARPARASFIQAVAIAAMVWLAAPPSVAYAQEALAEQLAVCAGCHGKNGVSTMENTPSLAGHPVLYTQIQLFLFREAQRVDPAMNAATEGMSDAMLTELAEHYAAQKPSPPTATPDPALDARGREIAVSHRCGACHLPDYAGRDQMPRLAGQREDYLLKALRDYKAGNRAGDGAQMAEVVYNLGDDDLKALAHHIAHVR